MSFPSGVQTATLTFSNPLTFLGNEATRTELTVQPSAGVVWAATGQPIDDFAEIITPGPGLPGQLNIPFVDQDGFTDQAGNSFKMWAYVLTRKTFFGNTVKTVKKYWQPLIGQDSTDFDNLPGGTVGLPVAVSPVPVTSVAGEIGAVSAEALVTKLSPLLPDGVTPEAVEANLPERLEATALSATYALKGEIPTSSAPMSFFGGLYHRLNGGWTVGFGDSLTSPGAYQRSHFEQLAVRSGQRVARLYNAGVPQDTTQQMLARIQADVLDKKPDRVVFMAGTNNIGTDQDAAKVAYRAILDLLTVRGIAVALVSIPPRTTAIQLHKDQTVAWNAWMKDEADRRGLPYVDIYSALVDPATGNYKPEYTSDDLHMSALGASVAAQIEASTLANVWPSVSPVYLTQSATDTKNLFANGTLLDTSPVDGVPDGFTVTSAPTRATVSVGTDPAIVGNYVRINRLEADTGVFSVSRTALTGFAPGDVMEMAVRFRPADGHSLTYNIYANVADAGNVLITQPYPISNWTIDFDGAWGIAYNRFVVPPNAGRIQMYVSTASGLGALDFAQFTLTNRTALAVATPAAAVPTYAAWGTYPAVTPVTSNSDPASILVNPLLSDADTNGTPDSWTITTAPARATVSVGTDAGVTGNYVRITRAEAATGAFSVNQSRTTGFVVGDTLEAAVKFRSPSNAVTANFYVLCVAADGTTSLLNKQILTNWANETNGFQTAAGTFVVPANTVTIRFYMHTASGVGYVDFAQATLKKAA